MVITGIDVCEHFFFCFVLFVVVVVFFSFRFFSFMEPVVLFYLQMNLDGNQKTLIGVSTKHQSSLPIVDWAPQSDVTSSSLLSVELGPVCFVY